MINTSIKRGSIEHLMERTKGEAALSDFHAHLRPDASIEIKGGDMQIIAESLIGLHHDLTTAKHLADDITTNPSLRARLAVAPIHIIASIMSDIREAWRWHKGESFNQFLLSRKYKYHPSFSQNTENPSLFGASLADESIVSDRIPSHLRSEDVFSVLAALHQVEPAGRNFIEQEIIFPGVVGVSRCVETSQSDCIVFAQRQNRKGLTRFVKNRDPEPCSSVFVVLKRERQHRFVLITGFIGRKPTPEPWDARAFSYSKNPTAARRVSENFWNNHALIYDRSEIIPGSERPTAG